MKALTSLLLLLSLLISSVIASSPPSFCKCTCFTNSTIIPLNPSKEPSPPSAPSKEETSPTYKNPLLTFPKSIRSLLSHRTRSPTPSGADRDCTLCNRAFCLSYNLPICRGAEEKDIFTTCFQRDSRKDQIFVIVFICATLGLLGWAGVRGVMERRGGKVGGFSTGGVGFGMGNRGPSGSGQRYSHVRGESDANAQNEGAVDRGGR